MSTLPGGVRTTLDFMPYTKKIYTCTFLGPLIFDTLPKLIKVSVYFLPLTAECIRVSKASNVLSGDRSVLKKC